MSINFCTISSSPVDSFCGARRAIVLQNLIDEAHPPVQQTGGGNPRAYLPARHVEREEREPLQPVATEIIVTVETFGEIHMATQPFTELVAMVTVTNLEFSGSKVAPVSVNSTEITYSHAASRNN